MPDIIELANQFRAELLANERKAAARLLNAYGNIWSRLYRKLAVINQQIEDARAKGEIVNPAWLFRQERYGDLLRQVDQEFKRFADKAEVSITKQQSTAVSAALGDSVKLMAAAATQAGISTSFNRLPTAAFENLIGFLGNGSPLSALLDELPRSGRVIVEQGLLEAVALGIGPAATARKIRDGLGMNLTRALSIARTETLRAYRTATSQTYQANSDVVKGWFWRSARSRRSCAACIAMDGTFHPVTEPMHSHVRCRCTQIPAVKTVTVDNGVDWFDGQPADVQKDILATDAGYKAFKNGELKLKDFVGLQKSADWGDAYYQLSVKRALAGEGQFPATAVKPLQIAENIPRFALTPLQIEMIRTAPPFIDAEGNRDSSKIAVSALGLTHSNPFSPGLESRVRQIEVEIERIELGRESLDRERLLRLAEELAQGLTEAGLKTDPIRLSQKPDGDFVVSVSGNHRVALLKMMGFRGEVTAKAQMQRK